MKQRADLLARRSHAIAFSLASSGGFFHHSSGKNERIQTKLGRKKLCHKGNPQENLGAYSIRGAPIRVCSYVASPFDPSERKRLPISASNHVILLLIYAHRQKFRIFYA